jgi:hypothetical protein
LAASEEKPAGLFPPSFRIAASEDLVSDVTVGGANPIHIPVENKSSRSGSLRAVESEDVSPAEAGGGLSHAVFFST